MKIKKNYISSVFLSVLLTSCGNSNSGMMDENMVSKDLNHIFYPEVTDSYLKAAEESTEQEAAIDEYIKALNSLTNVANLERASQILAKLKKSNLNYIQEQCVKVISSKIAILNGQPYQAIKILEGMKKTEIPEWLQESKNYTLITALSKTKHITKALELASDIKEEQEKTQIILRILSDQPIGTLIKARDQNNSSEMKGWFDFAILTNSSAISSTNIQKWQHNNPNHPANKLFKKNENTDEDHNIAILLPLKGPLAETSNKITQGFLASYYNQNTNKKINLSINDTSETGIDQQIEKLNKEKNIDIIITGLGHDKIEDFNTIPENAKLIYLSNPDDIEKKDNIYYFSLSQAKEAEELADSMINNGYNNVLVLSTQEEINKKTTKTFSAKWYERGGNISITQLSGRNDFANSLKESFGINLSENRASDLEKIINQKIKFVPTRRNDIDAIFLATNASDAREIKPLLKYYFAGDIPVFTISSIYNTSSNSYKDKDLNGVIFKDTKWLLEPGQDKNIKGNLQKLWGQEYQNQKRLYGVGIDLYKIATNINNLAMIPTTKIPGATGKLSLNENNQIIRELNWMKFIKGTPRLYNILS
jgi:outer membrane PBP1 activator LpoA protein